MQHFILGAERVIAVDPTAWGRWVRTNGNLEIARTEVAHLLVLTSFAGMDLSFGDGQPAFFETRVLDGTEELECLESASWGEAVGRHRAMAERWGGWTKAAQNATTRALAPITR